MNPTFISWSVLFHASNSLLQKAAKHYGEKNLSLDDVEISVEDCPLKESHSQFPQFFKVRLRKKGDLTVMFFELWTSNGQNIEIQ